MVDHILRPASSVLGHQNRYATTPLQPSRRTKVSDSSSRRMTVRAEKESGGKLPGFGGLNLGTLKLKVGEAVEGTRKMRLGEGTQKLRLGTIQLQRGGARAKDPKTVFVAGATGRLGARVVRELLAQGFSVRAGARNMDKAAEWKALATQYGIITGEQAKKLAIVPFDLTDEDSLAPALGNASRVVCTVGAPESDVLNASAPRTVDGEGSIALIEAAEAAGVSQFVLVTSLGTGKIGWPASALNLFWCVLTWKRKAEEALERSRMTYAIVRPGGMERPTDDYKKTHNVRLLPRDSVFGGQVSRLQVAEVIGTIIARPDLAENKCLEVVAETTAPLTDMEALLEGVAQEVGQQERIAANAAVAAARDKLEALEAEASQAAEAADALAAELAALRQREAALTKDTQSLVAAANKTQAQLDQLQRAAEQAREQETAAKAVLAAAEKAGREGVLLSSRELQAVARAAISPPEPEVATPPQRGGFALFGRPAARVQEEEEEEEEEEQEVVRKQPTSLFGGLFGKPAAKQVEEEEEEEAEEEVVEDKASPSKGLPALGALKLPSLGGTNGAPKPAAAPAPKPAAAAPPKPPAPTPAAAAAPPKPPAPKPAAAAAPPKPPAPTPPPKVAAAPKPTPVEAAAPATNGSAPKQASSNGDVPPNVQEAREWIAAWRARTAKPANPLAAIGKLFG